ncbi:Ureidoglycolate lyase [Variovorax sp. PBL-H6]|uniref:fumarylacetoacetate hydrolase family protein n=1 Tax=Variovorax sp. PBL-H6 TaxID=434009 RepID=UPI0013165FFA|nr:fumarylacetoacetate hydrolase family protein [Variovorax sp. PBL-H6]VTU15199.1 Ureidoglycolate lyase [Variovorax sp. PBL-H6]
MRLATFSLRSSPERQLVGVLRGDHLLEVDAPSMKALLARGRDSLDALARQIDTLPGTGHSLQDVHFLPPVPDADKFLCVGKNYRTHLEELKRTDLIKEMPSEPTGFVKLNDALTGHDTEVVRPASVTRLDYEPEMVFVIGKAAHDVKPDDAMSYVAGITILNDLTCRDTQKREVASGSRFWTAKNAPGFGPLGPFIITMDEVPDPYDIWVTCSVNGEQRMRVNTSEQIWKLSRIIEHFSRLVPLMPGDMFSTGAPGGVAVGKANAEDFFLKPGDVVECAFEAPAMVLRNRIAAA